MNHTAVECPLAHDLEPHDAVLGVEPEDDEALPHLSVEQGVEAVKHISRSTDVRLLTRRDFGVEVEQSRNRQVTVVILGRIVHRCDLRIQEETARPMDPAVHCQ